MVVYLGCNEGILPWPECLGTFDEESCRFFLRELGQKVVQFYPFSVGMEEVFMQIVDRYGFCGAPDAMSVLQELLEDENTASGNGDDGDIWRSWRHSWRHRNDDPYNPYVPRVRGQILPPPTSTRVRLLRATNFEAIQLPQKRSWGTSILHNERCSATSQLVHNHNLNTVQESCDLQPRNACDSADGYHKASFNQTPCKTSSGKCQNNGPQTSFVSSQPSQGHVLLSSRRYNPGAIAAGSPYGSMPLPGRRHGFPFDLLSPRRRTTGNPPHHHSNTIPEYDQVSPDKTDHDSVPTSRSPATQDTDLTVGEVIRKTPLSMRLGRNQENRYSLPSDIGSTDFEATPSERRAAHRKARLIDGALFHGKTRKGNLVGSENTVTGSPAREVPDSSSHRSSWQSIQQSSRASWLQNIVTRFRGEHNGKSKQPKLRKQHSALASCTSGSPNITKTPLPTQKQTNARISEMRQTTPLRGLGFNGASDDYDNNINNKPLPLSPADQRGRPSIQSETQRAFFGRTKDTASSTANSSGLFTSSGIIQTRDKDELRSLVSATMSGPQELSPKEKALRYRFSSSTSQSDPPSPKSSTTSANTYGYHHSVEPPMPGIRAPALTTYHKDAISSTVWPFRAPHEKHEHEQDNVSNNNLLWPVPPLDHPGRTTLEDDEKHERMGRRPATPTSPSKLRFGIRDSPSKTPQPRSRSPVKKLMGMVKSISTSQMPNDPAPSKTNISTSINKRRWKELSHKLRHGFLTPDLEQLDQEEMMEHYAASDTDGTNGGIRIITPPTSRQRPVFPVSIKSSGQSKLWSELEYMLIETSNSFLKEELESGRLSRDSIVHTKRQWQAKSRPQVIEFYYDITTQYDLIIANLRTIQLYSDYANDAIMLNSVLYQWKILIRELSVKTLCMPDSIVRRWLHDERRVLELLGASQITLSHLDRLSSLCLAVIGSAEKERAKARSRARTADMQGNHWRSASDGSQHTLFLHEQALLRGRETPLPPMPTPSAVGSAGRKVTPQGRRIADTHGRTENGTPSYEANHFVFRHGHGQSRSLRQSEEHGRFVFD